LKGFVMARTQEQKRKTELGETLRLYRVGSRQAATALGNRHKSIAVKVVDELEIVRGKIDRLIALGSYSPSVLHEIKKLQLRQRTQASGFAAAIKKGSVQESRTVLRFLISTDAELAGLLGIETA